VPGEVNGIEATIASSSRGFISCALEGMEEGATGAGLALPVASALVRQVALGTALLLGDDEMSPADLKDRVASPGGTTIAGVAVLEDHGVRGSFIRAITRAADTASGVGRGGPAARMSGEQAARVDDLGQTPNEGRAK